MTRGRQYLYYISLDTHTKNSENKFVLFYNVKEEATKFMSSDGSLCYSIQILSHTIISPTALQLHADRETPQK
jgi:hypothetical protein